MSTTELSIPDPIPEFKPSASIPEFDQIVKGNVIIEKLSKHNYRITFSKIGKFLMYQVWDKDSVDLNKKRSVFYLSAMEWVTAFKASNEVLDKNKKPLFTPTTVIEMEDDSVYAFVIHTADINSSGHVVFTVSTKEISLQNNTSKKLTQLPRGKCNNVRFDIDYMDYNPYSRFSNCRAEYMYYVYEAASAYTFFGSRLIIAAGESQADRRCKEIFCPNTNCLTGQPE